MAVEGENENRKKQAEDRRESGMPGGGQGRRDEVGRSGVYPMSGPHPPGEAEVRGQASWGQGERGGAGYEDHGASELSYEYGQLLGGPGPGPGGEPTRHGPREIPVESWRAFLASFSRQHEYWLVNIEVVTDKGAWWKSRTARSKGSAPMCTKREAGSTSAWAKHRTSI